MPDLSCGTATWRESWGNGEGHRGTIMKGEGWHFLIMRCFRINILRHILLSIASAGISHTFLTLEFFHSRATISAELFIMETVSLS